MERHDKCGAMLATSPDSDDLYCFNCHETVASPPRHDKCGALLATSPDSDDLYCFNCHEAA